MIHLSNTKPFDTAIVGGGILGLWAARHAIKRGERVVLLEKRRLGAGASGGFLGALMPHMPDNWNEKKEFQLKGLSSLPETIATLEDETGVDCGYRNCGRIMPVTNERLAKQIDRRIKGAQENWQGEYKLCAEPADRYLINPGIAKFGVQKDTLSARVNPRQYMLALESYVRPRSDVIEGSEVIGLDPAGNALKLASGETVLAGRIVVASGYEAYSLLHPVMGAMNDGKPLGRGVKGQAVLLQYTHDDTMPIVYHDGTYVVPHAGNRVAIGSTSVNDWEGQAANGFDDQDMGFYERAIDLVPALKHAPIIEKWAAIRPRNTLEGRGTEPYFGPVPGYENFYVMIGGFKITLGIGHLDIL